MPRALSALALLGVLAGCAGYEDASLGSDFPRDAGSTPPLVEKCDFEARRAEFERQFPDGGAPARCQNQRNLLDDGCPGRVALEYFYECASEWANLVNAID